MDCTRLVIDILSVALDAPVSTDMPTDANRGRYVLVSQSGDQSDEHLLRPRYDLMCWGGSDRDAQRLAISAVEALREAAEDHDYLSAVQLETMSREEWSRTGQGRYLAIVDLVVNTDE